MGYPPPCQPPLVTAESSSPSSAPKSGFQIVDLLFPRCLLPGGRVSVHLPPKWLVPRVVSIPTPRRLCSSLPVANSPHSHRSVRASFQRGRPFSKASLEFGSDRRRSVSTPSEEGVARFPSVVIRFQFSFPKVASLARFSPCR